MMDWLLVFLLAAGATFSLLAAVGVLRMPDVYMRIQAAAKSSTLGVSCLVLAAALYFDDAGVTARSLLVIAFLFLTAPVAAHMIGRAAYLSGVPLWEKSIVDELRGKVDVGPAARESSSTERAPQAPHKQ